MTVRQEARGPMDDSEFQRRRARRNRAILLALAGMVVLFYVLSIVRVGVK